MTQVLIVGAGPTGLMMACQLSRYNIPFRIIEREKSLITTQSRALGVQARTLEVFEQMGISKDAVLRGEKVTELKMIVRGKKVKSLHFGVMGENVTKYPYMLILEQFKTEQLLLEFLEKMNKKVEWATELVSFTQNDKKVTVKIKKNGREEEIEADYLIGADGARSVVRTDLNIPFAGQTYKESFFVLDCKIDSQQVKEGVVLSLADHSFAAFFPMTKGRYRIVGIAPDHLKDKDKIEFSEVAPDFGKDNELDAKLYEPGWISLYHSHHRCVANFRDGRIFLAGDAAHIHSPAGAQGMNTGLQDAYNLSWKMSLVLQRKAKESILDTYNTERLAFAKKLVETTDRVFSFAVSNNFFIKNFRFHIFPHIFPLVSSLKFVRKFVFRTVSQTGISYHQSPLSENASLGDFADSAPKPGDRVPFVESDGQNIQDKLTGIKFHLFVFGTEWEKIYADLPENWQELIDLDVITIKKFAKAFGLENGGMILVRPDMYLTYRSSKLDREHFKKYLGSFLNI